jgi:hypothetical protein
MKTRRRWPLALALCISSTMAMTACSAQPAMAGPVDTAAYYSAASTCQALSLGVSRVNAIQWGLKENMGLWGQYMLDDLFKRLMFWQLLEQCPAAMLRNDN